MTVYVSCCNAQMNLTLDIITLVYALVCSSLFYQLPSCNLFTRMHAIIIYRETPLVNCGPRSFFLKLIKQPTAILLLSFSANKYHFPHIRLILCYSKPVRLKNFTFKLGQSILVVLCAGSTFVVDTGSAPCQSQPQQPSEEF